MIGAHFFDCVDGGGIDIGVFFCFGVLEPVGRSSQEGSIQGVRPQNGSRTDDEQNSASRVIFLGETTLFSGQAGR